MKMWTLGADVVREVRDALPIPMMTDAESIVLVVDGEEHAIKGTLPRPRDGKRVTAADVAEVHRMYALATDPNLNDDARRTMADQLANEAPRLAREVERVTAERDALREKARAVVDFHENAEGDLSDCPEDCPFVALRAEVDR